MRTFAITLLISMFCFFLGSPPVMATAPFQKVFYKKYMDKKKNPEYYAKVKMVKCWLCHIYDPDEPKKKKKNNPYSLELAKLLDKDKDKKNKSKILKAIETVGEIHSHPQDKNSPTYGELISKGEFPGGKPILPPKKKEEK